MINVCGGGKYGYIRARGREKERERENVVSLSILVTLQRYI